MNIKTTGFWVVTPCTFDTTALLSWINRQLGSPKRSYVSTKLQNVTPLTTCIFTHVVQRTDKSCPKLQYTLPMCHCGNAGSVLVRRQPLVRTEPPHPDTEDLRRGGKLTMLADFSSKLRLFTTLVFSIHAKSVCKNMYMSTEKSVTTGSD
jgi:hypothetical protein